MIINLLMPGEENNLSYISILPCVSCHELAKMQPQFPSHEARPVLLFSPIFVPDLEEAERSCQTALSPFSGLIPN